jgi:hypothetical protein
MGPLALLLWLGAILAATALAFLLSELMSGDPPRRAFRRWLERMLDIASFGVAAAIVG